MTPIISAFAAGGLLLLASASDFPDLDVRGICSSTGDPAACERDESNARRILKARWPRVSRHHKDVCLTNSIGVSPSYVALGVCLQNYLIINHRDDSFIDGRRTVPPVP